MSRRIFRRRSGIVTGDLLQDPVADIATLRLLPVTDTEDGQLILVKDINRLFSFVYGNSETDDDETVIEPSYNSSAGRWHALFVETEAVDPVAAVEAEPTLDLTGAVSIEGDLVVDMGGGGDTTGSVMVGSHSESELTTISLEGAWAVNVGTAQQIPMAVGTRVHVSIAAIVNRIGTPALGDNFGIAFNLKPSGGLPGATFCSGSLAGPDSNNSEIHIQATIHIANTGGGLATNRNIIVRGTCLQVLSGGAPPAMSAIRKFDTLTHSPLSLGSGMVASNVAETNDHLQVSVEATTSTQTLANHYEVTIKSIVIDFSKGNIA